MKICMRVAKRLLLLEVNKARQYIDDHYTEYSNEETQELYNDLLKIRFGEED